MISDTEHENGNGYQLSDIQRLEDPVVPVSFASSAIQEQDNRENAIALPPVDRGVHAWTFVASAFVIETLVWGFGFTYGIFQEWYKTNPPFSSASETAIGAIGTVALAIQYSEGLAIMLLARKWPHLTKTFMWAGLACACTSLFLSSFSTKIWHLILLQGILFGLGGGFLYAPVIIWLSEWFVQRRGLAGSLIFGGSGVGGALFPIMINFLLTHVGVRWTLRIWAVIMALVGGVALLGAKARLPLAPISQPRAAPVDFSFTKSPLFIAVSLTVLIQALAYFPVSLYMPTYTASLGLPRLDGTLALSMFNLASVVGQIAFGHLVDRIPYTRVMVFSGVGAALSAYLLWGFAHDLGLIFAFVVIFGSLSGGFSSIWPPACTDIAGPESASGTFVFGCFAIVKGVAAVIGPIVAAALHHPAQAVSGHQPANQFGGYGFTGVTLFVGSMMVLTTAGSLTSVVLRLKR